MKYELKSIPLNVSSLVHGDSVDVPMTCGFAFRQFLNSEKFDFDVFRILLSIRFTIKMILHIGSGARFSKDPVSYRAR